MNMNRPDMTEDAKSKDYTNKFLQKDSNPVTMKASGASCSMRIFCQKSQAISDETSDKSPATESSDQTKAAKHEPLVYRVEEIAQLLAISPETKSQGLFHQIQKEVTFCGLPHGADA